MIDTAFITVKSGRGGNGAATFRREKYVPKGGPDGGDGGDGGDVFFVSTDTKNTLRDFQMKKVYAAQDGQPGQKRQKHGADGADLEITVPVGTRVWEVEGSEFDEKRRAPLHRQLLGELNEVDQKLRIAQGGRGGKGNVHFKGPTNTTPLEYEIGGAAQEKQIWLELRLLADIGLVGYPNAGKSTLLSVLTQARPKIADYPFTTLDPHLGVLSFGEGSDTVRYVMADIPGIIEEASQGKGLGYQFLRHIERCRLLVYVLAPTPEMLSADLEAEQLADQLYAQWQSLQAELHDYNPELTQRSWMVILNKHDLFAEKATQVEQLLQQRWGDTSPLLTVSAATTYQIEELKKLLHQELRQAKPLTSADDESTEQVPVYTPKEAVGKPQLTRKVPNNYRRL